jgi:transposase-like protein
MCPNCGSFEVIILKTFIKKNKARAKIKYKCKDCGLVWVED